ncbi:hypothetical protein HNQ07_001570 [Deinococcus metalli]|uniref:Uncharacterized protein n=1 Tax=Deinococcus metalli TaxID=1141878 RepID=A0A7W8NQQ9_9DEIO|nr:hypothetical protein [Deinococcus metalli]MBB5376113.1 hypothetical protein [Deinococcus metalli]GHF40702.1 hypothetical protein GCM10017781_16700 [Deinococcus metalli]
MKSKRYMITRPCLQEGSLSLLKYLDSTFPTSGPAVFVDDRGDEHAVQIDRERMEVRGLGPLYHAQHLNVNDVLLITSLSPSRYQVEAIVKPYAPPPVQRREQAAPTETRRVVVSSTPHVREIRMQEVRVPVLRPADAADAPTEPRPEPHAARPEPVRSEAPRPEVARPEAPRAETARPEPARGPASQGRAAPDAGTPAPRRVDVRFPEPAPQPRAPRAAAARPAGQTVSVDEQLSELGRLTGYHVETLGSGVTRLKADLGTHAYAVLVATTPAALSAPTWRESADYHVQLCSESERPDGPPRLTREALSALIEHARLAPLSPVDLRGYWKAGGMDLESAASISELVSSYIAQRGTFSSVLLKLSQQPAHSVVSVQRLAERLGSGVNFAELGSVLDTLTRPPFQALTPLPGGQYLLRVGVGDLLTDLADYADGVRRRVRVPARAEQVVV